MVEDRKDDGQRYALGGGWNALSRLNVQHYLWHDGLYTFHPCIDITRENLKVAEIGLGTGLWAIDAAQHLPDSATIDGYDIDLLQSPSDDWLPPNVKKYQLNCLKPFPKELQGTYDIVHINLFSLVIRNSDPTPVAENLISLLKPGGHISWGEFDFRTLTPIKASDYTSEHPLTGMMRLFLYIDKMGGTKPSWAAENKFPSSLASIFREHGLVDVVTDRKKLKTAHMQALQMTALTAAEEIANNLLDGHSQNDVTVRELIAETWDQRHTAAYNVDRFTCVGRKPLESSQ